jgi:hypothetical protein
MPLNSQDAAKLAWKTLFQANRILLYAYGAVAIACLAAMGNAGSAPALLEFYTFTLTLCGMTLLLGIICGSCLYVLSVGVDLRPNENTTPSWLLRLNLKYKFVQNVGALTSEASKLFGAFILILLTGMMLVPLILVTDNVSTLARDIYCEAQFRSYVTIPGYRMSADCQHHLGEGAKPDPNHFLIKMMERRENLGFDK